MPDKEIDYTQMEKGTKVRIGVVIDVCPTCGRLGASSINIVNGRIIQSVDHKATNNGTFTLVYDNHIIRLDDTLPFGQRAEMFREKRMLTLRRMSELVFIPTNKLGPILQGIRRPADDEREKIAKLLGMAYTDLEPANK